MVYLWKMQMAVKFAAKTHDLYQKQKRKGKELSYITHPLTVGLILARSGAKEEVVIAGILHDTIEDSIPEKKVTHHMITERFGKEIADLVLSVTETDKDFSWEDRKQQALDHIASFSHDSLLVKSADLLSNTSEIVDDCGRYGDEVFQRFAAPKERVLWHYQESIHRIIERWPENPLANDLSEVLKRLRTL